MTHVPWLTITCEDDKPSQILAKSNEIIDDYYLVDYAKRRLRTDIDIMVEHDPKWVVNFLCDVAERVDRDITPREQT